MCSNIEGPDFLDSIADAEVGQGNLTNADAYRQRATEWRKDRERITELEAEASTMQARLNRIHSDMQRTLALA